MTDDLAARDHQLTAPDFLFGLFTPRARGRTMKLRRLQIPGPQAPDVVRIMQLSLDRPDLVLTDVSDDMEGRWLRDLVARTQVLTDNVPAEYEITGDSVGFPEAIMIPSTYHGEIALVALQSIQAMTARYGRPWLSLFAGRDQVRSTHLAAEGEREWQISQALLCVYVDGPTPQVWVESRGDQPTDLARLFERMDREGRERSGREMAQTAIASLSQLAGGGVVLSPACASALSTRAGANLQFATRLQGALRKRRWERMTTDRILAELDGAAGTRWGIAAGQVSRRPDGQLELSVSEGTLVRILTDAFGRSLLNAEDLIEGEGRPGEDPGLLAN